MAKVGDDMIDMLFFDFGLINPIDDQLLYLAVIKIHLISVDLLA
jgi:hypothetical protein